MLTGSPLRTLVADTMKGLSLRHRGSCFLGLLLLFGVQLIMGAVLGATAVNPASSVQDLDRSPLDADRLVDVEDETNGESDSQPGALGFSMRLFRDPFVLKCLCSPEASSFDRAANLLRPPIHS